jgi:hypothetical protein
MRSELVGRYAFAPKIYSISSMELRMIEFIVQYNVSLLHNILNVVRSIHSMYNDYILVSTQVITRPPMSPLTPSRASLPSLAKRGNADAPKPNGEGGLAAASYGSASHLRVSLAH